MVEPTTVEAEQNQEDTGPQPEEAEHPKPSDVKKAFGINLPSGKRERTFAKILLAIALIWVVVWATNRGYPFWPGVAGILTIPLLLAALVVDNLSKE